MRFGAPGALRTLGAFGALNQEISCSIGYIGLIGSIKNRFERFER